MFVQANAFAVTFCKVSPQCATYGRIHPAYTMYFNGAYGKLWCPDKDKPPVWEYHEKGLSKHPLDYTNRELYEVTFGKDLS